jgi:leucyl-tRNA synthetase
MQKYNHKKIEAKWQAFWEKNKTFQAKDFSKKPKKYVLVEFPYPSGAGLHMGHLRPYVAADVYARFNRMKGFETLFPMGWDAFGLPAENYAIKMGVHPSKSTAQNVKNAKKQIQSWGLSFDWSREVNTTDPNYYKWTQWLFLQFYKKGLAYEATGLINWCPKDKTGLANEEVIDGKCERCGTIVEKKELRQWYLKITQYAEKLLDGLKNLPEWPEPVKLQQENWIGKSTGAEIDFPLSQPPVKRFVILHGRKSNSNDHFYPWLKSQLEQKGFEVQVPNLPNPSEPNDLEQAEFVKRNCLFDENTVVIGHSFGGLVALRLLEQGIKMNRAILVSTPFSGDFLDGLERPSVTAALKRGFDFNALKNSKAGFTLLYDEGDEIVRMSDGEALAENLGFGVFKVKASKGHFLGHEEPQVLSVALGVIKVFTTRPDTIFGATYLVLAPEHPAAKVIAPHVTNAKEVLAYIESTKNKTEIDRTSEAKEKTGVELKGVTVINPATKEKIPVWVADYVLGHYGTGAIMAVPAHDQRDFEFAKKFNLPITKVVEGKEPSDAASTEYGPLINSGEFNGLTSEQAIPKMAAEYGQPKTQYKLRDWVFSRQRYWGEPIPIIHCPKCGIVPVPDKDLPVKLPPVKKYEPTGTGESPLAAISKWVNVKCPKCKTPAKRETNTMPQWAGSSWYWLRYTDPKDKKVFADLKKQKYWTPVDVYFGGMEHTTLHLLYSRFWNLFLYDQGLVTAREPYSKRQPHGIILGPDGEKMSKSRGNVVNPQDIVDSHGADTLRMFELFLGPHEDTIAWNSESVVGVKRFLDRVWVWGNQIKDLRLKIKDSDKVERALNKLVKKVTEDIQAFHFNTSVSAFMGFLNEVKDESVSTESFKIFLKLLYPFAPHISEELNQQVGKSAGRKVSSLQLEAWPKFDPKKIVDETVEIVVQVNGKVKGKITVPSGSQENKVKEMVLGLPTVKAVTANQEIKRVIFVPNRLINIVV